MARSTKEDLVVTAARTASKHLHWCRIKPKELGRTTETARGRVRICQASTSFRARMHHKVVGNFGSEADVRSLYYRHFRFNVTSDVGARTHGRPAK